jgi:hypothetical protein
LIVACAEPEIGRVVGKCRRMAIHEHVVAGRR